MDVIAVALLRQCDRVLLGHRCPGRQWYPDCWDLFGGHVEAGEDPETALVRECHEELDIVVERAIPLDVELEVADVRAHIFAVQSWAGRPRNAAPEEHDEIRWFDRAELRGLRLALPALAPLIERELTGGAR